MGASGDAPPGVPICPNPPGKPPSSIRFPEAYNDGISSKVTERSSALYPLLHKARVPYPALEKAVGSFARILPQIGPVTLTSKTGRASHTLPFYAVKHPPAADAKPRPPVSAYSREAWASPFAGHTTA